TGAYASAEQGEVERVVAAVDAHRVAHADERRQVLLESSQLLAIDQIARAEALADRRIDVFLVSAVVSAGVDERDSVRHSVSLSGQRLLNGGDQIVSAHVVRR